MRHALLFIAKLLLLALGSALLLGGGLCSLTWAVLFFDDVSREGVSGLLALLPFVGLPLLVSWAGWWFFRLGSQLLKDERHAPPPFEPLPSEKAPDDQASSEK